MAETALQTFYGKNNKYIVVGQRDKIKLGFALKYGINPANGVGSFIVRFVAFTEDGSAPEGFAHFVNREPGKFIVDPQNMQTIFDGVRLNKEVIPVFHPAPAPIEIVSMGDHFGIWDVLADWVTEQAQADGFTITVSDLKAELRNLCDIKASDPQSIKMVLEFPDLKVTKAALLSGHAPNGENQGYDA